MTDGHDHPGTPDPAAHRARTIVLAAFGGATVGAVGFVVAYTLELHQVWLGIALAAAFLGLGVGLVAWGHGLMPGGGAVEERAPIGPGPDTERAAGDALRAGGASVGRRGLLGGALATALSATGLAALVPALSLGPRPGDELRHTGWAGSGHRRLVTREGRRVRADQLDVGGLLTVFPEGRVDEADTQAVLVRLGPDVELRAPADPAGAAEGHVAYSKVCTHAGCPVGLYEAVERLLFCPCHQSSFDVVEGARPLMGPAERPLPQLPLAVDDEGFLVATGDFGAAVGPGWWSRP